MGIPPSITSGVDTVWTDSETVDVFGDAVTSSTHSLVYYFRLNTNAQGLTATSVAYDSGWKTTLSASETASVVASPDWFFQAVLTKTGENIIQEYSRGQIEFQPSLSYSGTPGAFDGRTQAQKDLDAVKAIKPSPPPIILDVLGAILIMVAGQIDSFIKIEIDKKFMPKKFEKNDKVALLNDANTLKKAFDEFLEMIKVFKVNEKNFDNLVAKYPDFFKDDLFEANKTQRKAKFRKFDEKG